MNSLIDTIDKIQLNSCRDIPVFNFDNLDPSSFRTHSKLLGINSPNRLTSFHSVSLGLIYGFGRRISKTVNGLTTYYVYDGDQIIEERDAAGNLSASYVNGDAIDEVLTMTKGAQTYYYFYDGLGSVTDITNANGAVVESYSYDVYGTPSQASTIGNRFMFTGREYEPETGL